MSTGRLLMFPFTIQAVSQLSTYLIIGIVLLENSAFLSITTEVTNMGWKNLQKQKW